MNKILPITGLEMRTSAVGSNRSTNWATTAAHAKILCIVPTLVYVLPKQDIIV